jgi:hypothetical protein
MGVALPLLVEYAIVVLWRQVKENVLGLERTWLPRLRHGAAKASTAIPPAIRQVADTACVRPSFASIEGHAFPRVEERSDRD